MQYKIVSRVIDTKKKESLSRDPSDKNLLEKVHALMNKIKRKKTRI